MELKVYYVLFNANETSYTIELKTPIEGESHEEIRKKAKRVIEEYMFENHIPGPYKLLLL